MYLSETVAMYNPRAEVVSLITTEEIEWQLTKEIGLKKAEFTQDEWAKIIQGSTMAIRHYFKYAQVGALVKNEAEKVCPEKVRPSQAGQR
jgi:response regulator of citrate/malate metabolism